MTELNLAVVSQLEKLEQHYGALLSQRISNKQNQVIFFKQRRNEIIRCNGDISLLSAETLEILSADELPQGTPTIKVYKGASSKEYQQLVLKSFNYRK